MSKVITTLHGLYTGYAEYTCVLQCVIGTAGQGMAIERGGESFHQDIAKVKRRYTGEWRLAVLTDLCWIPIRGHWLTKCVTCTAKKILISTQIHTVCIVLTRLRYLIFNMHWITFL